LVDVDQGGRLGHDWFLPLGLGRKRNAGSGSRLGRGDHDAAEVEHGPLHARHEPGHLAQVAGPAYRASGDGQGVGEAFVG
jgi:hypothetical protein